MNVFLFAVTGLGNIVLETLIKSKVNILGVSTRKEVGEYPYYPCENIYKFCRRFDIPVYYDLTELKTNTDLIVSATYHKKINIEKCNYKLAVNMHPSVLPSLKGKDPIRKALNENINMLGITVHKLTNKFDDGKILFSERIHFDNLKKIDKAYCLNKIKPLYREYTIKLLNYGF